MRIQNGPSINKTYNKHLLDETESNIQFIAPDKAIMGEAKLSPILFCTGAINRMLDEVKSNECFIIPKKSIRIN